MLKQLVRGGSFILAVAGPTAAAHADGETGRMMILELER